MERDGQALERDVVRGGGREKEEDENREKRKNETRRCKGKREGDADGMLNDQWGKMT